MNYNLERFGLDFVKHRRQFFILSSLMVIVGIILLLTRGLNLGIDFESGTRLEVMADHKITEKQVESELAKLDLDPKEVTISGDEQNLGVARFVRVLTKQEIAQVKDHFSDSFGAEPNVSTVSPTVGEELARNAFIAVLIASIGIIIYVTIRFEIFFALGAIIALLHDAFFIVAFFSLMQLEVDLTFIAAILTIVGYSINDTIVTFDRIRENMKLRKKVKTEEDLADLVNTSITETLSRSINTVLTVVFTVVALLVFGGEAIRNFSLALLVGLIAGTYSSMFIAAQLWLVWKARQLKNKRFKSAPEAGV